MKMDALNVLILGVNKYEFLDDKSQKMVKGCSVHYVQLTHAHEEDKVGYFPTKASLPYEVFEQFRGQKFPMQGDASISFDLANKRNPIKVTAFSNLQNVLMD
jgi:hypothetical protein